MSVKVSDLLDEYWDVLAGDGYEAAIMDRSEWVILVSAVDEDTGATQVIRFCMVGCTPLTAIGMLAVGLKDV